MRWRFLPIVAGLVLPFVSAGLAGLAGCGSIVETTPPSGAGGQGTGQPGSSTGPAGPPDAQPDYVDPGCPDGSGAPVTQLMCDPFHQHNGQCPPGEGCFVFAEPSGDPCGPTVYGAACQPAGGGTQGAPCDTAQACAAGFACVVTGSGVQCVALCPLQGASMCPPGFVCEPIDVQGFGGCL